MSTLTRITIDKARLFDGRAAYNVGGRWWDGFTSVRGVLFVCSGGGHAWLEHHGDTTDLHEGGIRITPDDGEIDFLTFNAMVPGQAQRLADDPDLVMAAVNRARVASERTAVTVFQGDGRILCPKVRLEGEVYSATVKPPRRSRPEPLNFWVETRGRTEVL